MADQYFEALCWEQADRYPADVIIVDSRTVDAHGGDPDWPSAEFPTWRTLPAVEAGQVGTWHAYDPFGYSFYDPAMEQLAALILGSDIIAD